MNFLKSLFFQSQPNPAPQMYNINGQEYHELNLLAEGGYGFVWRAIEAKSKKMCVLKKVICQSDEAIRAAKAELDILVSFQDERKKRLNHPNIVKCYNGAIQQDKATQQTMALMVLELCEGGTLFDLLKRYNENRLNERQVLVVLRQVVAGIKYLHSQNPPIQHRDLKVENILLHQKVFKLCDFGSASTEKIDFAYWEASKQEIARQEEIISRQTTDMYRPPEMADIYQQFEVSEKVDVWMLGCILYTMCFYVQPFQEASKLAIVEASYTIPKESRFSEKMHGLIRKMLTVNPKERPSIFQIEKVLESYEALDPAGMMGMLGQQGEDSQKQKKATLSAQSKQMDEEDFNEFQAGDQLI